MEGVSESQIAGQQKIKAHLVKVKPVQSPNRSLLSLVISPRDDIAYVITKLQGWITNRTYHDAEIAITFALEILEYYRGVYNRVPDNGLIIYTGTDGENDFKFGFEPFKLIFCPFNLIMDTFAKDALTDLLTFTSESSHHYEEYHTRLMRPINRHFQHVSPDAGLEACY